MEPQEKSRAQLIDEVDQLRREVGQLQAWVRELETALGDSQNRFNLFMEHIPAAVSVKDAQGRVIYTNKKFADTINREPEELVGQVLDDYIPPELAGQYRAENQLVLNEDTRLANESCFPTPDGPRHWLTCKFPIHRAEQPTLIGSVSLDITERKQVEQALQEAHERFTLFMNHVPGNVFINDTEGRILYLNQFQIESFQLDEWQGKKLEEVFPPHLAHKYRRENKRVLATGPTSFVEAVPGLDGSERIHRTTKFLIHRRGKRPLIGGVSLDISEIKQVEKALRRANRELEQRLDEVTLLNLIAPTLATVTDLPEALEITAGTITRLFGAYAAGIGLLNPDHTELRIFAHFVRDNHGLRTDDLRFALAESPIAHRVIEEGQATVIPNLHDRLHPGHAHRLMLNAEVHCLMLAPLLVQGRVIGLINIITDQPGREFTALEVQLAETIAGQVAGAIQVARLFETERRLRRIAESLRQTAITLNRSLNQKTVLAQIINQLRQIIPYQGGGIFLREGDELVLQQGTGIANQFIGCRISLSSPDPAAVVFNQKRPHLIADTEADPHWQEWEQDLAIRSWMGAPLLIERQAIGVLTADGYQPNTYTEEELQVLQIFADQAALAIQNARLHEKIQRDAQTKALLLSEVKHRSGNNLAAIGGMLYTTQDYIQQADSPPALLEVLDDLINRIDKVTEVHKMLTDSGQSSLSIPELARRIINGALQLMDPNKESWLNIEADQPVRVASEQANYLAIIFNELATNTLKHLPTGQQTVKITVRLGRQGKTAWLEYQDDGPGFPPRVLNGQQHNMGLYLLQEMVNEGLRGQLSLHNGPGAVVAIRFPLS